MMWKKYAVMATRSLKLVFCLLVAEGEDFEVLACFWWIKHGTDIVPFLLLRKLIEHMATEYVDMTLLLLSTSFSQFLLFTSVQHYGDWTSSLMLFKEGEITGWWVCITEWFIGCWVYVHSPANKPLSEIVLAEELNEALHTVRTWWDNFYKNIASL